LGHIVKWFVHNPIAANLLMVITIVMGLYTFPLVPKQFFPERELDTILVSVVYPGAGPSEIEQQVCIRIEEAIQDLDGIERVTATARESLGEVRIEVEGDYDSLRLLNEVKSRVDAITSFPVDAERPQVNEILWKSLLISVAIAGDIGEANLKELGEQLRDDLATLPEVQLVELREPRKYEISIEVSELDLRRYGLRFDDVVNAVKGSSLNLPAGKLRTAGGDIQLQTRGQGYVAADFESIVILGNEDGTRVLLGDVATVIDGFEESDIVARFDDKPFLRLDVYSTSKPDILKTSEAVYGWVEQQQQRLPAAVEAAIWRDQSLPFKARLSTLVYNGLGGLALVFIVLLLFLRPLLAFWVCLGIVVAFLGAIWLLPATGASLNTIALFAFILILGIVVDDAIIVGEAVYAEQSRGLHGAAGAVEGAISVMKPVWFAVITTMLFFGAFFLLPDDTPEARQIAWVVVLALTFSLIECMFILPAHLAHMRPEQPGKWRWLAGLERTRERFARGMERFAREVYQPFLQRCMQRRNLTLVSFLMALLITIAIYVGGWLGASFFPRVSVDYLVGTVTMHEGSPFSKTEQTMEHLEAAALELKQEVNTSGSEPVVVHVESLAAKDWVGVTIGLGKSEHRDISAGELKQRWQELIGELPDVKDFDIRYTIGHGGKDIEFELAAPELTLLREAASEVKAQLARFPGVFNVRDSLDNPSPEIELRLKPLAENLGVSLADLARQVRRGFYGEEVQRVPRLREDVKVMVRYPYAERDAVNFLKDMRIRAPDGREIPFEALAEIRYVPGYSKIDRVDGRRISAVTAEIEPGYDPGMVVATLLREQRSVLQSRYPGFDIKVEGRQQQRQEFLTQMKRLMIGTTTVVFGMMAIVFRSYWQPILILVAIPFGYMGAVVGHLLFGRDMSMFSLLGIIACAGVVVNDNLVLIDRVNSLRAQGSDLWNALLQGGSDRFRPIVLTSVTTFVGLLPITLERSVQAQFLIPMVLSLTFGVLLATAVTLIFVPCLYLFCDAVGRRLQAWFGSDSGSSDQAAKTSSS
jgi:multidrug efflux pump subunit AcrB